MLYYYNFKMLLEQFRKAEEKDRETFEEYAARTGMSEESINRGNELAVAIQQRQRTTQPA